MRHLPRDLVVGERLAAPRGSTNCKISPGGRVDGRGLPPHRRTRFKMQARRTGSRCAMGGRRPRQRVQVQDARWKHVDDSKEEGDVDNGGKDGDVDSGGEEGNGEGGRELRGGLLVFLEWGASGWWWR